MQYIQEYYQDNKGSTLSVSLTPNLSNSVNEFRGRLPNPSTLRSMENGLRYQEQEGVPDVFGLPEPPSFLNHPLYTEERTDETKESSSWVLP